MSERRGLTKEEYLAYKQLGRAAKRLREAKEAAKREREAAQKRLEQVELSLADNSEGAKS
jgi:hypothetical protein